MITVERVEFMLKKVAVLSIVLGVVVVGASVALAKESSETRVPWRERARAESTTVAQAAGLTGREYVFLGHIPSVPLDLGNAELANAVSYFHDNMKVGDHYPWVFSTPDQNAVVMATRRADGSYMSLEIVRRNGTWHYSEVVVTASR